MTNNVVGLKRPPRAERTQMDTMILTLDEIGKWKIPPFQRPLRVNDKVRAVAERLKDERGIMPGVITLGQIERGHEKGIYLLDGQHRIQAFRISELPECLADVRICTYDALPDMGQAFVELNSAIVTMRPDDVLRGLEGSITSLQMIRQACSFVGYDQVRRSGAAPVISMSALLRSWQGSANDTPTTPSVSAVVLAQTTTEESARNLVGFLNLAVAAWGRDQEYWRLWGALNLTLCQWLYRKLVLDKERGVKRFVVLTREEFKRCLMSVSASTDYVDWLLGRNMSERDRAPAYIRLKGIFARRLTEDRGGKILMPNPPWDTR